MQLVVPIQDWLPILLFYFKKKKDFIRVDFWNQEFSWAFPIMFEFHIYKIIIHWLMSILGLKVRFSKIQPTLKFFVES